MMEVTTRLKHSDATGRQGRLSDHAGRNASERRVYVLPFRN